MTLDSLIAETAGQAPPLAWPAGLNKRGHLSASQLTLFARCPEQYRRVYVLGERRPPAGALIFGSADHKAHELNFAQKISSGVDLPVDDVKTAFAEAFDNEVEKAGGENEVEWENDKPGDLKDTGVALVAHYTKNVSPRIQPLAVEEKFEIEIPGVPLKVIGYVDVRAVVGGPATLFDGSEAETPARRLIERKTGKRKETELKPDWRLQGLLYQSVAGLPVDWHLSTKTKTPAVYTPDEEPGLRLKHTPGAVKAAQDYARALSAQIVSLYNQYGPDEAWPTGAPVYGWACGFCGFRDSCNWWAYERQAA